MKSRSRAPHPRGVVASTERRAADAQEDELPARRPVVLLFPRIARRAQLSSRWCTPELVAEVLDRLVEEGAEFVSSRDALPELETGAGRRSVVLGFEVADEGFARWIWPALAPLRLPVTLFVDTGHVGQRRRTGPFGRIDSLRLPWSQLAALRDAGVEFGTRGHHDVDHAALPEEVAFGDLVRSRREMERRLGVQPEGLLFPGRRTTHGLRDVVDRIGFRWALRRGGKAEPQGPFDLRAVGVSRWDRPAAVCRRVQQAWTDASGPRERRAEAS